MRTLGAGGRARARRCERPAVREAARPRPSSRRSSGFFAGRLLRGPAPRRPGHLRAQGAQHARGPRLVGSSRNTLLHEPILTAPKPKVWPIACLPHDIAGPHNVVRGKQAPISASQSASRRVAIVKSLQPLALSEGFTVMHSRSHGARLERPTRPGNPIGISMLDRNH